MTSAADRRALTAARGRKHRALRAEGLGVYHVKAHRRRLHTVLVGWGVPRVDALRKPVVEIVLTDLVQLMINDPVTIARVTALLAARKQR